MKRFVRLGAEATSGLGSRKGAKAQRRDRMLPENDAAREVVDAAYRIHKTWGPGLLESAYAAALEAELRKR